MQENTQETPIQPVQAINLWPKSSEVFGQAVKIFKQKYRTFLQIMVIPLALTLLLGILVGLTNNPIVRNILGAVLVLSLILLQFCAQIALILAIPENANSKTVKQLYSEALAKIFPLLLVGLLSTLTLVSGFMFLIIPGLVLALWFSFAQFIVVLENVNGLNALLKSREYVRGLGWKIIKRYIFIVLVLFGFMIVLGAIASLLNTDLLTDIVSYLFIGPLIAVYMYLTYQNAKQTKGEVVLPAKSGVRTFFIVFAVLGLLLAGLILVGPFLGAFSVVKS